MSDTTTLDAALAYYARHECALFPMLAGSKNPTGLIPGFSFADDCSADPAIWARWRSEHPGCNFGLVAGPSRLVVLDVDVTAFPTREDAWAAYVALCRDWGIPDVPKPQVQSARGGWHVLFRVPADVNSRTLRQPDAIKKSINVRAGNGYVVAAGSFYDGTIKGEASGPYLLMDGALPPHAAPSALVEHCTRRPGGTNAAGIGQHDPVDVAALLTWMASGRDLFDAYEDWVGAGMALRLEFGDAGLPLWRLTHNETVTPDVEASKWESFTTEPNAGVVTLNSLMDRAHQAGWTGSVRKSTAAMFSGLGTPAGNATVAALAAASGATTFDPAQMVLKGGISQVGRGQAQHDYCAPIIADFLASTTDQPFRPTYADYPQAPEAQRSHPLYSDVNELIPRLLAIGEANSKALNRETAYSILNVIGIIATDAMLSVARRLRNHGCPIKKDTAIQQGANGFKQAIEDSMRDLSEFIRDGYKIKSTHPDNLAIFHGELGLELRFNAWVERIELRGGPFGAAWVAFDDPAENLIRMLAFRREFEISESNHRSWTNVFARYNTIDPAREVLDALERGWDGLPRLATWLSVTCGVPEDDYHAAVGANIIGGMVRRVRQPGCKHDTMAIFCGFQGAGKSKLARVLCPNESWFTESIKLGDESKELVLTLAGKMVAEISEMGSRGSIEDVKAMLSRTSDMGRPAYARSPVDRPRRNIFIGSSNETRPLLDPTGNRRFLPVLVAHEIDLNWLARNVAQLIGEACRLERAGYDFNLPREVWGDAAERQEAARAETAIEVHYEDWFGVSPTTENAFILAGDLEKLCSLAGVKGGNKERGPAMENLGFRRENVALYGRKTRIWIRSVPMLPRHIETLCVRYVVDESHKFPRVVIRPASGPDVQPGALAPPLPPSL